MFKLDNNLLEELGLGSLPEAEKGKLLAHIYETLEMRVGMKLAERMSKEQMSEFERFINGDFQYATSFLDTNRAGWQQSQEYQDAIKKRETAQPGRPVDQNSVTLEFAALSWLEINFPNYKQVVSEQLEQLKTEIKQSASQILTAAQSGA